MALNVKKIFSFIIKAQLLYTATLLTIHIFVAKSISNFWHGELLAHFLHYEIAIVPFLLALAAYKKFPKTTIGGLVVCAVLAGALYKNSRPQVTYEKVVSEFTNDRLLQVICYNGNVLNKKKKDFINWVRTKHKLDIPTIFVLIEASSDWSNELLVLEKQLPHTQKQISDDNFGMYVASNLDLSHLKLEQYANEGIPAFQGEIKFHSKPLSFASLHPFPPISNFWFNERESYLKAVKGWFVSQNRPGIACGDFNTTAYTQSYAKFTATPAPFKDTFWGPLRPTTWGMFGLNTSIDFIFYSPEFDLVYAEVGPKTGSDHAPVTALLRWK